MYNDNNINKTSENLYVVKLIDVYFDTDSEEKYNIPQDFKGMVTIEGNNIIWKIESQNLSLEDLVKKLMDEFSGPYMIITPKLEIIIDFTLNVCEKHYNI